jgi:hypothetical protein
MSRCRPDDDPQVLAYGQLPGRTDTMSTTLISTGKGVAQKRTYVVWSAGTLKLKMAKLSIVDEVPTLLSTCFDVFKGIDILPIDQGP